MPAVSNLSALPREELALVIVEGEGAIQGLIGEKILGPLPLSFRNAHLVKATLGGALGLRTIAAQKYVRGMGARYERMNATFSDATLTVTPRGAEIQVPSEMVLDYKTKLDVLAYFTGLFGTTIGGLTKELLIANTVMNSTAFYTGTATNSLVPYTLTNSQLPVPSGMNPIQDIINSSRRVKALGERPDTVVMSGPVWERIRVCQSVLQFLRGTFGPIAEVTMDLFTKYLADFGIKQVLVGDNYYNTAADGVEPGAMTQVFPNTYILVCKAGMNSSITTEGSSVPSLTGIGCNTFWESFNRNGIPSANLENTLDFAGGGGYYVETYPSLELKSEIVRVEMTHLPTITNTRAGDIIATQYS